MKRFMTYSKNSTNFDHLAHSKDFEYDSNEHIIHENSLINNTMSVIQYFIEAECELLHI